MAVLKCKMCGGTMNVDRAQNLAICPYCGSRSALYERDENLFSQFQTMFAALLGRPERQAGAETGFWVETSREELTDKNGTVIEIRYLIKTQVDLCVMYVAKEHVIYVFKKQHEEYAHNYIKMTSEIRYPNQEMEKELGRYVPQLQKHGQLSDGSTLIAIRKEQGVYPVKLLGPLIDRHVAWVISRLENLCCLLSYNEMVLNALTLDNLFVDPANHQIYLYGGWWFAGYQNSRMMGASGDVQPCIYRRYSEKKRCHFSTDLEALRLAAIKLLGYGSREELEKDAPLPAPFFDFLMDTAMDSAQKDFSEWDRVLKKAYGERKFIPLKVTEEELYSTGKMPDLL